MFNIGYSFNSWPTWMNLIEKNVKKSNKFLKYQYVFFPLTVIKRESFTSRGLEKINNSNIILFILNSLFAANKEIKVVIRPHPTTELKILENIIKQSKHDNIILSNVNATVLIKNCDFVVRYGTSTLDPRAIHFHKVLIRHHNSFYKRHLNAELKNKKSLRKLNIYDTENEKDFMNTLDMAIKNKIKIIKHKHKVVDEVKIVKKFQKFI